MTFVALWETDAFCAGACSKRCKETHFYLAKEQKNRKKKNEARKGEDNNPTLTTEHV